MTDIVDFSDYYNQSNIKKILFKTKSLGNEVIEKILMLYFASKNPEIPIRTKAIIYSALGYLVLPTDAIPDFIPVAGYTEDITVLATAIGTIGFYIDGKVKAQARQKMSDWFD